MLSRSIQLFQNLFFASSIRSRTSAPFETLFLQLYRSDPTSANTIQTRRPLRRLRTHLQAFVDLLRYLQSNPSLSQILFDICKVKYNSADTIRRLRKFSRTSCRFRQKLFRFRIHSFLDSSFDCRFSFYHPTHPTRIDSHSSNNTYGGFFLFWFRLPGFPRSAFVTSYT